jgi:hypothetical protein
LDKTEKEKYIEISLRVLRSIEKGVCSEEIIKKFIDEKYLNKFLKAFTYLDIVHINYIISPDNKIMKPYIRIKVYRNKIHENRMLIKYKLTGLEKGAEIYLARRLLDQEDVFQIKKYFEDNKRVAISPKLRDDVLRRDNFTCRHCGRSAPNVELHIDHITPVSKGGETKLENLQTLCAECNFGKGNKYKG